MFRSAAQGGAEGDDIADQSLFDQLPGFVSAFAWR
jgi:hypothetical protein